MRLKHFLKLKEKTNQETWIILTRYNLASILYRLDKNFKYMISNNTIKTEKPNINFYYEDIITYLKKQNAILELPKNSRKIYKQIIQNEYKHYIKIGQSHWNQYSPQTPWNELWKNTFYSYNWPENNNILYLLLHFATRTNDQIHRWTNQKYLKSPNCKLCDKTENITHLYIDCKRNKKIWKYFQKYYQALTQKQNTPLQHILTISSLSLPPKTKKLTLTLTTTILTYIWKTRNKLHAIIPATNVIINIKNELKNIILTHYKRHTINNTLHEFHSNFCINNTLCKLTQSSITMLF